jgi:hypothetical protein
MSSLFFTCPKTKHRVSTGIEMDMQSLKATWRKKMKVRCPHCGEKHKISVCETYLEQALFDAAPPPTAASL